MPTPEQPDRNRQIYDAYAQAAQNRAASSGGGDGGSSSGGHLDWDTWQDLSEQERINNLRDNIGYYNDNSVLNQAGNLSLGADDDLVRQFQQQFGTRDFDPVELNNQRLSGYEVGYGDPTSYGMGADDFMQDSGRILRLPDGRYVMESGNRRGEALAEGQSRDSNTGLGDNAGLIMAGLVLGGGMLGNTLGAGALGGGAVPEVAVPGAMQPIAPTTVGGLGSGASTAGGSLGAGSLGLGGGGGALGSGTSLVGTGLGGGGGALGTGTSLAGTGLGTGAVTGTGAVAGGAGAPWWSRIASALTGEGGSMPGTNWMDIIRGGLNLYGQSRQPSMSDAAAADREYNERMWRMALQANRPNQYNEFGSSEWSQDPQTGQWTQRQTMNEQDRGRLNQYRDIAANRMNLAGQVNLNHIATPMNYAALNPGLAQIAQAAGVGGTMGGALLNQRRGG